MSTETANARRRPAVAGMFYPGRGEDLARSVTEALAQAQQAARRGSPRAIIAPHAGHAYSGWLAAAAFASTAGAPVRHAVVLAPSHRHAFDGIALPTGDAYAMPGFDMPINTTARQALVARGLARLEDAAHEREHAVEVELPFLHAIHPRADVVPLVIGRACDAQVAAVIDFLDDVLDRPLFVLSSDLSHFLPEAEAREKDAETARLIETGEPAALTGENACGARALRGYLVSRAGQGARVTRLALANSAAAGGDPARVVGYGAWALHAPEAQAVAPEDRDTLLATARTALEHRTRHGAMPPLDEASFAAPLQGHGAAFVTLTEAGRLRGCIGTLRAHQPLVRDVAENAAKAGHADPRFPPVAEAEQARLRLKIAVLGPAAPMGFTSQDDLLSQLAPGEDGLILSDLGRRGTFLPMVWDSLTTPEAFFTALKQKAGLPRDHWSPTLKVWRYRAESFAEA